MNQNYNCLFYNCLYEIYSRRKYYWCPKIRNNFWCPSKMLNFPILRSQYWTFLHCPPFSYRSSSFAIVKVVALCFIFILVLYIDSLLLFCIVLRIVIALQISEAIAKIKGKFVAIAFKRQNNYKKRNKGKNQDHTKRAITWSNK